MNRIFGVRAIALGAGYLAATPQDRALWHRLWLLCDAADTAMGAGMTARRRLPPRSSAAMLLLTGAAVAVDVAALRPARAG